ncbi:MAG: pre-peptidase C-terminal domain-containing protein, partial [Myxococcales bacterium]|nr:pre-peptidase C-terminal domain-containing protein [Myxococcales bacterium]
SGGSSGSSGSGGSSGSSDSGGSSGSGGSGGSSGSGGSGGSSGSGGSGGSNDSCPGQSVSWTGSGSSIRTASLTGTTAGATADLTGSCGSTGSARDVVYAFTADVDGRLLISVDPEDSFDAVLYVRESTCASNEIECQDGPSAGGVETVEIWATAGTTYYAVVDGYLGDSGAFTLDASLAPEVERDACPGEIMAWTGTGPYTWSASGDTSVRADDHGGSSCGSSARDVVFAMTAPATGLLSVDVTSSFDAEIYLSASCGSSDLVCKDGASSGGTEHIDVPVTSGTTYYLVVDGYYSDSEGSYSVNASLEEAPAYDTCPGEDLTFSGNTATVNGSTAGAATNNYTGSCGNGGGGYAGDAVFHFVAPQSGSAQITVNPTGSTYDPVLYVRSGSCTGSELACVDKGTPGGNEVINLSTTQGTDYWVFVDGYAGKTGDFSLTVQY